jgi:hypothetical protein
MYIAQFGRRPTFCDPVAIQRGAQGENRALAHPADWVPLRGKG